MVHHLNPYKHVSITTLYIYTMQINNSNKLHKDNTIHYNS